MKRTVLALAAFAALCSLAPAEEKIDLLVITGNHAHDWVNTTPILVKFLNDTGRFNVSVTTTPERDLVLSNLARYQVLVFHYRETDRETKFDVLDEKGQKTDEQKVCPPKPDRWPEINEKALLGAVEMGKGLVVLHYATSAFDMGKANWPEFEKLIGGGWRRSKGNFGHGTQFQFKVKVVKKDHPITQGFPDEFLHSKDELYHKSLMVEGNTVLITGFDDPAKGGKACTGKDENLGWVRQHGQGRVFTTVLGHGPEQMRLSPGFQALVSRGAEWAATGKVTIPLPAKLDADPVK
jgi:type 1 glutamine amidotransferase